MGKNNITISISSVDNLTIITVCSELKMYWNYNFAMFNCGIYYKDDTPNYAVISQTSILTMGKINFLLKDNSH